MMIDRKRIFVLLMLVSWIGSSESLGQTIPGLSVPPGFQVTKVAGDELATNIYCMAVSPRGEAFVSGPGYIKRLIDADGDGVFESTSLFSNQPVSGAQGICFDGNDLLCTGDDGLLRFVDADGDRVADGPPEKIFPIKTGGEHHAHAIRKGADGWWYVLAGNQTPILDQYFSGPNSPVVQPRAGFLMRISPDWKTKEVFAHGFRNAYDFDFNSLGEVFVYDSDGERDISLPWYRPTRLFKMRAGDDAGWVTASWKRPSSFFDMPIEIGALGRGSPTGVVVNDLKQFPNSYDDAIFVADWTFGRVVVFRHADGTTEGESPRYDRGTEFVVADGQFGFAVTDLDFAADGSLLISVGGRGTQGGIYRVSCLEERSNENVTARPDDAWVKRSKAQRMTVDELAEGLNHSSRRIQEAALEAMVGRRDIWGDRAKLSIPQGFAFFGGIEKVLESGDSKTAGLALRVLEQDDLSLESVEVGFNEPVTSLSVMLIPVLRGDDRAKGEVVEKLVKSLALTKQVDEDRNFGFRLAQLLVGGCGEAGADPMFVGYTASSPVPLSGEQLETIADHLAVFMNKNENRLPVGGNAASGIDESGRLAAMLGCGSASLQTAMISLLARDESTATQDIHWLNCISQTSNSEGMDALAATQIAAAITGLGRKIERDGLNLDRNFYPRMRSLTKKLFELNDGEIAKLVATSIVGSDDDVYLFGVFPKSDRRVAQERMADWVERNPDEIAAGQIEILGSDVGGKYLPLIRSFSERRELKAVVIRALARKPEKRDRAIFIDGLASMDASTVKDSAIALRRIHSAPNSDEALSALKAAARFGWDKQSVSVRDQLVLLLTMHSEKQLGYRPKQPEVNQSEAMERWMDWGKRSYPDAFEKTFDRNEIVGLVNRLALVDWNSGNRERGKQVYQRLQCAQCHDAGSRLGPRLEGVTQRFSRDDLFQTIVAPDRQVADRYRAILIETVDGQFFKGSVVYESVDGITLQESSGNTIRINQDDIELRVVSEKSLMPEGLLNEASDQDWADLYSFLRSR